MSKKQKRKGGGGGRMRKVGGAECRGRPSLLLINRANRIIVGARQPGFKTTRLRVRSTSRARAYFVVLDLRVDLLRVCEMEAETFDMI